MIELVAGWSSAIQFQLTADGEPVNLTGATVTLKLTNQATSVDVTTTGDVAVDNAATGLVSYTPDVADLIVGTYLARWKVVIGSDVVYFPSSAKADTWVVGSETV